MVEDELDDLARAVRDRRVILFAGAGLFHGRRLAVVADADPPHEGRTRREANEGWRSHRAYQTLAEYYRITRGSIGPLRIWMDRTWTVSADAIKDSALHRLIVELDFPIIYTTNYDRNLEVAFDLADQPYVKIANAREWR